MHDIKNEHFLEWLRPVKSKRRFELLNSIGLSQEKRGVSDKSITKNFLQIQDHSYVVLKNLTDDGIQAQTSLYTGCKNSFAEKSLSESNNKGTVDIATVATGSILEQKVPLYKRSLEDDEESIEIAISEDSDPFETISTEYRENESKYNPIIQEERENRQGSNLQNQPNSKDVKDLSNLEVNTSNCKRSKNKDVKTRNTSTKLSQNIDKNSKKDNELTYEFNNDNHVTDKCGKIRNTSDQCGREETNGGKGYEKDALTFKASELESSSSMCIEIDSNMMRKEISTTQKEKYVKYQPYNNSFKNNLAFDDKTKSLTKIGLAKLQEKLEEKLKSKDLDFCTLGSEPEHAVKDSVEKIDNDSFKNNRVLGDKTIALKKLELSKIEEKGGKLESKNLDVCRIGLEPEQEIQAKLSNTVTNELLNKQKPLIFVSKNLFDSPSTGEEMQDKGIIFKNPPKGTKHYEKIINEKGLETLKKSHQIMQSTPIEKIVGNDTVEDPYTRGTKICFEKSVKRPLSNENVIKTQGTTRNKDLTESEQENSKKGLENSSEIQEHPKQFSLQFKRPEKHISAKIQDGQLPGGELKRLATVGKRRSSEQSSINQGLYDHQNTKKRRLSEQINKSDITIETLLENSSTPLLENSSTPPKLVQVDKFNVPLPNQGLKTSMNDKGKRQQQQNIPTSSYIQLKKDLSLNQETLALGKKNISKGKAVSKEHNSYLHDPSAVVKGPTLQVNTSSMASSTTSLSVTVDNLLSDNTVSSSTHSAFSDVICEEPSPLLGESKNDEKSKASLEKGQSLHPLQNLQTSLSSEVQINQHLPSKEPGNAMRDAECAVVGKAVKMYLFYFQNPKNINDCIPFEFRSALVQYVQAKGFSMTNTSNHSFLFIYFDMYREMMNEFVDIKINKCAEILHLAIADWNRKIERNNRALKLTSESLRDEEMKRAEADYNEMLLLRGKKFKEIFELLMSRFTFCEYPLLATLYYRITLALVNIDQENINHIYNIRVLIMNLLKSCGYKFSSACNAWFNLTNEHLTNTYHFVKHALVALHLAGFNQKWGEDVMKFYHLHPYTNQLKQMVLSRGVREEATTSMEKRSPGIKPTNDLVVSVEPPKKPHAFFESLRHLAIQQQNRQLSIDPDPQSALLINSNALRNPPQPCQEQRRVETVTQNPSVSTQQQNQIQVILQSRQQLNMKARPLQQHVVQSVQRQRLLQTVGTHINQQQNESISRENYKSQNFGASQNIAKNIQCQPSATTFPYQDHIVSPHKVNNLYWKNQIMQQMQQGSNASRDVAQNSQQQFAAAIQNPSTILSYTTPDNPGVIPQWPTSISQRAEPTNTTTPTEDLAGSLCCHQGCMQPSLIVCSMCRKAPYCSKSCQEKDWYNSHSSICLGLRQSSRSAGYVSDSNLTSGDKT